LSSGVGGTLIASGTSPASATTTGRELFGQLEYTILVDALSLDISAGHYWVTISPVGSATGSNPFASGTVGANCIGLPCGDNANAFYFNPANSSFQYYPTTNFAQEQHDYSFGVIGSAAVPEPGTFLLSLPLGFLLFRAYRRRLK
jgi:hypothetical protein